MAIQNLLNGFEVGWVTFVSGAASALLLRWKLSRSAQKKPLITEEQK
jgi:hypothetical protein